MANELPLSEGYHFLYLKCRTCGTPKRLSVPAVPIPQGSMLPTIGWGQDACCLQCGASTLEVMNEPSPPSQDPPPPPGWTRTPT